MGGEEVHEFGFWEMEAQGAQGDAEFVVVEVAVSVQVEEGELCDGVSWDRLSFDDWDS